MSNTVTWLPVAVRERVSALFRDRPPVIIEVRFPRMGTSSDWYLFETEEELERLHERLGPGVELHLASAWDIEMGRGKVAISL